MASVRKLNRDGRKGWRVRFYIGKQRRELYLAGVSKRTAETVGRHVDELAQAKANNIRPASDAAAWANGTEGRMRESLVRWGLADPIDPRLQADEGRYLGPYLNAYIEGRTDAKRRTIEIFEQTRDKLVAHFGDRQLLRDITAADADRWRRSLKATVVRETKDDRPAVTMAPATVSLHVRKAKTMLAEAVRARLIPENPFANQRSGNEANKERHHFVDRTTAAAVLKVCPNHDWRLIFALARFGGLRCPSEVTGLQWPDVLWEKNRLRIASVKTEVRFTPIWPELLPILEAARRDAPEDAVFCVQGYRGNANLGTQLHRIIRQAGLEPWEKTFVNLRSTRRTELEEHFPPHAVDAWMGHSSKVAAEHYLQVTDEHWQRASGFGSPIGPPIPADQDASGENNGAKKPRKTQGIVEKPKEWDRESAPPERVELPFPV